MTENEKLIAELKAKYGIIRTLIIPLDEDDETKVATIYLKKPDKTTRDLASKLAAKSSEMAIKAVLNNLYIGGDSLDTIYASEDAMESLEFAVVQLLKVQQTIIKKN
jgi:hypothetical protein